MYFSYVKILLRISVAIESSL